MTVLGSAGFVRLVAMVVACAWVGPAAATSEESIALQPLDVSPGLGVSVEELEGAVMKGLAFSGRRLIAPTQSNVGEITYLVGGDVSRKGAEFWVKLRLLRAADKSELDHEENHCDSADCSLAELARRSARELVRRALGRAEAAPPPAPAPAPAAAVEAPRASRSAVWPAVGIGAGAGAIGVGILLIAIDSGCTGMPCRRQFDTKPYGIAAVAAGAVMAGAGVYLLLRDRGGDGASVGLLLGPGSLAAVGRF